MQIKYVVVKVEYTIRCRSRRKSVYDIVHLRLLDIDYYESIGLKKMSEEVILGDTDAINWQTSNWNRFLK